MMNKALKAALLSALVFPGLGHFFLKKPIQGWFLLGTSVCCLYFLISALLRIFNELTIQLHNGAMASDVIALSDQINSQLTADDSGLINCVSLLLLILWIVAIADSFRLGRMQDQQDCQ